MNEVTDRAVQREPGRHPETGMPTGIPVASTPDRRAAYDYFQAISRQEKPILFQFRQRLVGQGRADTVLGATDRMFISLKTYAAVGENELHAHPHEDHTFIVMQGKARFEGPNGEIAEMGPHQGLLLPRNTLYRFTVLGSEPLVMLRVGVAVEDGKDPVHRTDLQGQPMDGYSETNRTRKVVFLDKYFE